MESAKQKSLWVRLDLSARRPSAQFWVTWKGEATPQRGSCALGSTCTPHFCILHLLDRESATTAGAYILLWIERAPEGKIKINVASRHVVHSACTKIMGNYKRAFMRMRTCFTPIFLHRQMLCKRNDLRSETQWVRIGGLTQTLDKLTKTRMGQGGRGTQ